MGMLRSHDQYLRADETAFWVLPRISAYPALEGLMNTKLYFCDKKSVFLGSTEKSNFRRSPE